MKILLTIVWLVCAYFNWGMTMGYCTHLFPEQDNVGISIFVAAMGPLGTIISVAIYRPMHWRIKPASTEERWEYFHGRYPSLDKEYFERKYN